MSASNWFLCALLLTGCSRESQANSHGTGSAQSRRTQQHALNSRVEGNRADPVIQDCRAYIESLALDRSDSSWRTKAPRPPELSFREKHSYYWSIATNCGEMTFKLLPGRAPRHVASLLYLTLLGYYDGLQIHRIEPGFLARGGCPLGNGRGSSGFRLPAETSSQATHDRAGLLSAAPSAGLRNNSGQFVITLDAATQLDGKYTLFGSMVAGSNVLPVLNKRGSTAKGRPTLPVQIVRAWIRIE